MSRGETGRRIVGGKTRVKKQVTKRKSIAGKVRKAERGIAKTLSPRDEESLAAGRIPGLRQGKPGRFSRYQGLSTWRGDVNYSTEVKTPQR